MPITVFVMGAPGPIGGAGTELWHTVRLWRERGVEVHLIPTWDIWPAYRKRCEKIGCVIHDVGDQDGLILVPEIAGSIVVAMCNGAFLKAAERLRNMGCRIVWAGCMNWMFEDEIAHYRECGTFDSYVFQSKYQMSCLTPRLREFGAKDEQFHLVRAAFYPDEFPHSPRPHLEDQEFVLGRMSRPDPDKHHPDTWQMVDRVLWPNKQMRIMGWDDKLQKKLGSPPQFASVQAAGSEHTVSFLNGLHAYFAPTGSARENWPRVGLEAMSCGVPLIVDNACGWPEMIEHGVTGFLCDTPDDFSYHATVLARDELLRQKVARDAYWNMKLYMTAPDDIWRRWEGVLSSV